MWGAICRDVRAVMCIPSGMKRFAVGGQSGDCSSAILKLCGEVGVAYGEAAAFEVVFGESSLVEGHPRAATRGRHQTKCVTDRG